MTSLTLLLLLAAAPRLAVPNPSTVNVKPELAQFMSDQVARVLRQQGLSVVTASEIQTLLSAERQRELMGCGAESQSCMAELSNALGVDMTVMVTVARLDDSFRGSVKVVGSDAKVRAEETIEASGEKQLLERLEQAAANIGQAIVDPQSAVKTPALRRAGVGLGIGGAAIAVTGALFLSIAAISSASIDDALKQRPPNLQEAETLAQGGKIFQTLGWVFVGGGAAAVAAGVAMFVLGAPSRVQVSFAPAPGGGSFVLGGSF